MMSNRNIAIPAALAACSLVASPVSAADLPQPASYAPTPVSEIWTPGGESYESHRRYRHRRHRGVDAGDVLAGILIVGGIAAIASAAKGSDDRRDRYRERDYRDRDRYRSDYRQGYDGGGIDRAVDRCTAEIQRDVRVDSIDTVNRAGDGWQVTGSLFNGDRFTCFVSSDGRIDAIDYGQPGSYNSGAYDDQGAGLQSSSDQTDRQYDSSYYAAARARMDGQSVEQPAYPGGPLPGETVVDDDIELGTGYQGAGNN